MILIATGEKTELAFHQAVVFADQLHAAGYDPVLDGENLPEDTPTAPRFHALPYLRDLTTVDLTHVIILGAEANDADNLNRLRRLNLRDDTKITAFGTFQTAQDEISATARLTYVTGQTPVVHALGDMPQIMAGSSICPCFGVDIPSEALPHMRGKPTVTIVVHDLKENGLASGLQYLSTSRTMNAAAYMSGKDKSDWMRMSPPGGHIYGFSEIGPTELNRMSSVLVMLGSIGNNQNALCLLNNHLISGGAIIDATPDGEFERAGLPVHRGPTDIAYLPLFLDEVILPNLEGIKETTKAAASGLDLTLGGVLADLPLRKVAKKPSAASQPKVHFMPTNGIGLGHAQRCVLIAEELKRQKVEPAFFAFPSCLPMINRAGFEGTPLVSRSTLHNNSAANDLANYTRVRSQMNEGDVFVFDGGYVFDSITRSISNRKLASVWIRRGLWRTTQNNQVPLDREKFFARVIVPQEALPDLNTSVSSGTHIRNVGPTVRQVKTSKASREKLFKSLKKELSIEFDKLVVTMLGSGVVHDMSANVQSICANIERRQDCLNLIVVWPSSHVPSERYAWNRSKVVKTMQASWLAAHADFVISAAGYNSFHEALYNQVPTIFVPQDAQILDDQEARAEAAAKLGLAAHVPSVKLSKLDREMNRFLDHGKADELRKALKAYDLPEPGNGQAADLIKEMMG